MGLMKPYADTGKLSAAQKQFNYKLSSSRMIVENANARLKNKWRRLKKVYTQTVKRAEEIVECCLILHNFLLKHDSQLYRYPNEYIFTMPHVHTAEQKRDNISRRL
jgi:hypothetical protein